MIKALVHNIVLNEKRILEIKNTKYNSVTYREEGTTNYPISDGHFVQLRVQKLASDSVWKTIDESK